MGRVPFWIVMAFSGFLMFQAFTGNKGSDTAVAKRVAPVESPLAAKPTDRQKDTKSARKMASNDASAKKQAPQSTSNHPDKAVMVASDDAEMNAAIRRARETLGLFWKMHDNPKANQDGFALKVKITDENGPEHFWLLDIKRNGDKITGRIDNNPERVKNVKIGQTWTFTKEDVSDWMYRQDGKIHGGFSIRVLLKMAPPEQAKGIREMLAFEPK